MMTTTTPAVNPYPDECDEYIWQERHRQIVEELANKPVEMIFIGDSITHYFGGRPVARYIRGGEIWEQFYGHRHAVNMGCGFDRTQHMLWRLDHGALDNISPKLAIVLAGINNVLNDDGTAEEIAEGIRQIIERLKTKLPETKILLVGIFPYPQNPDDPQRETIRRINRITATFADQKQVFHTDIGDQFLLDDNSVNGDLFHDYLHPNSNGCGVYAKAIEPLVASLLGEE